MTKIHKIFLSAILAVVACKITLPIPLAAGISSQPAEEDHVETAKLGIGNSIAPTLQNFANSPNHNQTVSSDTASIASSARQQSESKCAEVEFVFARGSGEALGDDSMTAWKKAIEANLKDSTLSYKFYELGSAKQNNFQYPAVAVSGSLNGFGNLLGAYVSGGDGFDFGQSVIAGSSELRAYVKNTSKACPNTQFVLGGYSQGAMLISRILDQLPADKILYVATFGDPKLYLPEGKGFPSAACLGRNYSSYRIHVPDCEAYEGILGSYRPYQTADYVDKLGTWCNEKDIMCSSGMNIKDHTSYVSGGLYQSAANKIQEKLIAAFPEHFEASENALTPARHNLALIIDTTGSMENLIDSYKREAARLASEVLANGGQVALYEYRDLKESFQPRLICDFGSTLEEITAAIDQLYLFGGRDLPESALSAIMTAMNTLSWQPSATKSIMLLTDAGFLAPDVDGTTLADVVQRSLEIDPVNIYVMTEADQKETYAELARLTNGAVFDVRHDLVQSTDMIINRPVAILPQSEYLAHVGDTVIFNASGSYSPDGESLSYDWDLDGDGEFEIKNSASYLEQQFDDKTDHYIQVRATNSAGYESTMSAHLQVSDVQPAQSMIEQLNTQALDATSSKATFQTNASKILVIVNEAILGFLDPTTIEDGFILTEIRSGDELTLIPYDSSGRRGEAQTTVIHLRNFLPTVPNTGTKQLETGRWANYMQII